MLNTLQLDNILFLDIETVPEIYRFTDVDPSTAHLFEAKNQRYKTDDKTFDQVYD